jgi:hypothetical protein
MPACWLSSRPAGGRKSRTTASSYFITTIEHNVEPEFCLHLNTDGLARSRHSGENRQPVPLNWLKILDWAFAGVTEKGNFRFFTSASILNHPGSSIYALSEVGRSLTLHMASNIHCLRY